MRKLLLFIVAMALVSCALPPDRGPSSNVATGDPTEQGLVAVVYAPNGADYSVYKFQDGDRSCYLAVASDSATFQPPSLWCAEVGR